MCKMQSPSTLIGLPPGTAQDAALQDVDLQDVAVQRTLSCSADPTWRKSMHLSCLEGRFEVKL